MNPPTKLRAKEEAREPKRTIIVVITARCKQTRWPLLAIVGSEQQAASPISQEQQQQVLALLFANLSSPEETRAIIIIILEKTPIKSADYWLWLWLIESERASKRTSFVRPRDFCMHPSRP